MTCNYFRTLFLKLTFLDGITTIEVSLDMHIAQSPWRSATIMKVPYIFRRVDNFGLFKNWKRPEARHFWGPEILLV